MPGSLTRLVLAVERLAGAVGLREPLPLDEERGRDRRPTVPARELITLPAAPGVH